MRCLEHQYGEWSDWTEISRKGYARKRSCLICGHIQGHLFEGKLVAGKVVEEDGYTYAVFPGLRMRLVRDWTEAQPID